jgi:tetratricopeptide (TPR) repeat protein
VVRVLEHLDRLDEALILAQALVSRAPKCSQALEMALHLHLNQHRKDEALVLAREALARFPEDDGLAQLAATALSASGLYVESAPVLEAVARRHPEQEGVVRVLLSTVLRNPAFRAKKTAEYERLHQANPDDELVTFLLGVVKHYANEFAASSALLGQVEESFDHQGRLHIYLAMNDFNLGKVDLALERLHRIAERPVPDPDIFYCRAEILRDRDRAQAIADLQRYMAPTGVNILANPDKSRRVDTLIANLEACQKDGSAVCEGPWEHPRFRHHTESEEVGEGTSGPPWGWVVFALLVACGFLWRRMRCAS